MMDDDAEAYDDQGPEDAADLDTEADVTCPHCGATVRLTLDPAGGRAQDYVEDCEVCCRPWRGRVGEDAPGAGGGAVPAGRSGIKKAPVFLCRRGGVVTARRQDGEYARGVPGSRRRAGGES